MSLQANKHASKNDIAIIGFSCRYPGGVYNPKQFFDFLLKGGNGIVDVPKDRWDNDAYFHPDRSKPNRMFINRGGFLSGLDLFDPLFFGISPKEANNIDPQHRWLLELTYEVFENAGVIPTSIRGSDTSVFIGQFMHDYEQILLDSNSHKLIDATSATGSSMTLTANRISYLFDLTGPSVTLDTACSSSLVALDMACKTIRNGDSEMAIAGGVNILLRPELTMSIATASMLSPDCLCKSFDESANGYVRSEGAGIVLIKSLEKALRDNDPIHAIIRATGINQDGQTKGITVPNGDSQAKLLKKTLKRAGISSKDIQYAEAHGTGTAVGDPIEVNALGKILGDRPKTINKCIIGSVKSNMGHMESAAGMAGLMKTVLSMNHGVIPKNIHLNKINPAIDLEELNLRILTESEPWPDSPNVTRKALVNSFGFGGTNANVVLEQFCKRESVEPKTQAPVINHDKKILLLSAKSQKALLDMAEKYIQYFEAIQKSDIKHNLHDICYTASIRREHFKHRLAINAQNDIEFTERLRDFVDGTVSDFIVCNEVNIEQSEGTCFVFSGMGTQCFGAGKELYDTEPVYRKALDQCSDALYEYSGWSLVDVLFKETAFDIDETDIAQPIIFATQIALYKLLVSWGIQPSCIVGHSAGEVAAAYCAGVYSFEDAIKIIYHRSSLQQTTSGRGKMLAVGISEPDIPHVLHGYEDRVSVAAINSENAITLAGDDASLVSISDDLDSKGIFTRFLKVSVPFHSPVMDELKQPLINALDGITAKPALIPLYSTVTGERVRDGSWGAEYWPENVREPVKFKNTIEKIAETGITAYVELAPHSALSSSVKKNLETVGKIGVTASALSRSKNSIDTIQQMLSKIHTSGHEIDWSVMYPNKGEVVSLPNYPWQHVSYWCEAEEVRHARINNAPFRAAFKDKEHPLLGGRLDSSVCLWQNTLDTNEIAYMRDHRVGEDIIFPGAGYVEMALSIANHAFSPGQQNSIFIENISFHRALYLREGEETLMEISYSEDGYGFSITAFDKGASKWSKHASGTIRSFKVPLNASGFDIEKFKTSASHTFDHKEFYDLTKQYGLSYQGCFKSIEKVWVSGHQALAKVEVNEDIVNELGQYCLHPVILDGAFQTFFATADAGYLPVRIESIFYYKKPQGRIFAFFEALEKNERSGKGNITLFDEKGELLIEVIGLEVKAIVSEQEGDAEKGLSYHFEWIDKSISELGTENDNTTDAVGKDSNQWLLLTSGAIDKSVLNETVALNIDCHDISKSSVDDLVGLFDAYADTCSGIIYTSGSSNETIDLLTSEEVFDFSKSAVYLAMRIAQAYDKINWRNSPGIVYLTENVQHIDGFSSANVNPIDGVLWGFARVQISENPNIPIRLFDIEGPIDEHNIKPIIDEISSSLYEQEVAFRGEKRFVHRLCRLKDNNLLNYVYKQRELSSNDNFELLYEGHNKKLCLNPTARSFINASQISLKVQGCYLGSINDLCVNKPALHGHLSLCVGEVVEIGSLVQDLAVGEQALFISNAPVAAYAICDRNDLIKLNIDEESDLDSIDKLIQAAIKIQSDYVFGMLNRLPAGSKLYIHNASLDQGRNFVNAALEKGFEIVVGLKSNLDDELFSRTGILARVPTSSVHFKTQLLSLCTEKFDAIIGDVYGGYPDFVDEIAKEFATLIYFPGGNYQPCLSKKPIIQVPVSINDILSNRCQHLSSLLGDIMSGCCYLGSFSTPKIKLSCLSQADGDDGDSGPLAVDFSESVHIGIKGKNKEIIRTDSTYLVTGGLGSLGLSVMHWLVEKGAKSIVLIGRREPGEAAKKQIEAVRSMQVSVNNYKVDISSFSEVELLIKKIQSDHLPLAGIFHSAGVLEDSVIAMQSEEKISKVLMPKILGAFNLHQTTKELPVELFVCFSSIASVVGWSGQSNYAAANAFMDSFAHYRVSQGLPCLSVNWGPWSDSGMAANLDEIDIKRMNDAGMYALSAQVNLQKMDELLAYRVVQAGVFDLEWDRIEQSFSYVERKTVFEQFISLKKKDVGIPFYKQLTSASEDIRETLLANKITQLLAQILGIDDPSVLKRNVNLFDYGINSLMAMEFKNKFQSEINCKLPASFLPKNPTIDAMLVYIKENAILAELNTADHFAKAGDLYTGVSELSIPQRYFLRGVKNPAWGFNCHYQMTDDFYDVDLLEKSIRSVVSHHDALRARFRLNDDKWQQFFVEMDEKPFVNIHDWSHVEDEDIETHLGDFCDGFVKTVSIENDSLIRIDVFQRGTNKRQIVMLSVHHLCSDGLSEVFIIEDLLNAYSQLSKGLDIQLPTKTMPFYEYTNGFESRVNTDVITQELSYWESLPWSKVKPLAVDYPDDGKRGFASSESCVYGQLSWEDMTVLLREIPSKLGCQSIDIIAAAYVIVARRWLNSDHVAFRLMDSGRSIFSDLQDMDLSRTVGWMAVLNTMLVSLPKTDDFIDIISSVAKHRENLPNKGVLPVFIKEFHNDKSIVERISRIPEPAVWINYFPNPAEKFDVPIFKVNQHSYLDPENIPDWRIIMVIHESNDGLKMEWHYNRELFDPSTIQRLSDEYCQILIDMASLAFSDEPCETTLNA